MNNNNRTMLSIFGDLGDFIGIEGQSGKIKCQGDKPDTGKFHSSCNGIMSGSLAIPKRNVCINMCSVCVCVCVCFHTD